MAPEDAFTFFSVEALPIVGKRMPVFGDEKPI
jgi:hypothetical protein